MEYAEGGVAYFARHDPIGAVAVPVVWLEIAVTLAMFAVWEICRRRGLNRSASLHILFLALCFAPFGIGSVAALRALPFNLTPVIRHSWFWPAVLIAASVPIGFALRRPRSATWAVRGILLYSWPVLMLVLLQAARGTLLKYPAAAYADGGPAVPFRARPAGPRVVWIIFDELSETIAFGNRPADLRLPNLDGLQSTSFHATSAVSPADSTEISMPSLILGEQVLQASPRGPGDLRVRTGSGVEPVPWSSMHNVFDDARDLGYNTALAGWYHPYGRLLNRSLTKCYWTAGWLAAGIEERRTPRPLADAMWDRARLQVAALPLAGHLSAVAPGVYRRRERLERFSWLRERALEVASDPAIGLALIHLPIPHPPSIYNRATGTLTARGGSGYLDSVILVDRTLGELRRALERAGLWDGAAVLVSSDHGWRTRLWRGDAEWTPEDEAASRQDTAGVPFILKLPGQKHGVGYAKRFNTIVTRQLITAILNGRLTNPEAVGETIEAACP